MSEHHWPALFERHPQPMWIFDPHSGGIIGVNDAAIALFGFTRPEFLASKLSDLRARESVPSLLETWTTPEQMTALDGPSPIGVAALRTRAGVPLQMEITVSGVRHGGRSGVLCMMQEVTAKLRAEEAFHLSQERFVALTKAVNGTIWDVNLVTGEVWRGEGPAGVYGWQSTDVVPEVEGWIERLHPDDAERVTRGFRDAIESGQSRWREEYRLRQPDGTYVHVEDYAWILHDAHGRPVRMIGLALDVTEKWRAEEERREAENRLQGLFESTVVGIAFGRSNGDVYEANDALLRIIGYTREDLRNGLINVYKMTPPELHPLSDRSLLAARGGNQVAPYEKEYVRKDGTRVPVLIGLSGFKGSADEGYAVIVDLTERKRAQAALAEHQRRLQALFEYAQDGLMLLDDSGRYIDVNPAACQLLGYTREELIGRDARTSFPESERARVEAMEKELLHAGHVEAEVWRQRKDGSLVEVEMRARAHITPGVHLSVVRDLARRRQAEEALRESEERFRSIVESSLIGMGVWGIDGTLPLVNETLVRMLGYSREDLAAGGVNWRALIPPEHEQQTRRTLEEAMTTGQMTPYETELFRKDGSRLPVFVGATLFAGDRTRGPFFVVDLTDRKRAERELADRQRRLQGLFEGVQDAILLFDDEGLYVDCNPAACKIYGYEREELLRLSVYDLLPAAEVPRMRELMRELLATGRAGGEQLRVRKDGVILQMEGHAVANVVPGVHLAVMRDIAERRRAEATLRNLSARLLRLQDEERRRLARELHDSTAQGLAAISIGLAVISESSDRLPPRERRALDDAQTQVQECARELRTIAYLLHPPLLDEMGLTAALRGYLDGFARRSGIEVGLEIPEEIERLPRELETALFRIVQECLTNIHRHSGSPTAQVRLRFDAENIVLEVADQGHGLSPGEPSAGNVLAGDLGVGIAGMQERVRQLGGRLDLISGRIGTTVRAVLPRMTR